jgi:hypothetical protein
LPFGPDDRTPQALVEGSVASVYTVPLQPREFTPGVDAKGYTFFTPV